MQRFLARASPFSSYRRGGGVKRAFEFSSQDLDRDVAGFFPHVDKHTLDNSASIVITQCTERLHTSSNGTVRIP